MEVLIWKARRMLEPRQKDRVLLRCPVGAGPGACRPQGAGRATAARREGTYYICLVKEAGKYGKSSGPSYPSPEDAARGLRGGTDRRRRRGTPCCRAWAKPGAPAVGHGAGRGNLPARGRRGFRLDAGLHRAGSQRTWPGCSERWQDIETVHHPALKNFPKESLEGFSCTSHRFCRASASTFGGRRGVVMISLSSTKETRT